MLYERRRIFNDISLRIGMTFSEFGLTPNQWTLLSLVFAVITAWFLSVSLFPLAALFLFFAGFLDFVDGSVARYTGMISRRGAYVDTIMDRYVEGVIAFGLIFSKLPGFYLPANAWVFLYFFGSIMTTYAKAAAKEKDLFIEEMSGGILERAERLSLLFIGVLLAGIYPIFLTYILVILAILSNITALQRIKKALGY